MNSRSALRPATSPMKRLLLGVALVVSVLLGTGCKMSKVKTLTGEGGLVEADGRLFRSAGLLRLSVATGIDWFELGGAADFDGVKVDVPRLLSAIKRGEKTVALGDGSVTASLAAIRATAGSPAFSYFFSDAPSSVTVLSTPKPSVRSL